MSRLQAFGKKCVCLSIVGALLLTLFLASCTTTATTQTPTPTPTPTVSSPSPTPTPTTAPKEKIIRQTNSWPCILDPGVANDLLGSTVALNLYDSLLWPNPDGSSKECLATKWETAPDNVTYTFTLRQGVKFHNGDIMTADDVVFTMQRLLTMQKGYAYLFTTTVAEVSAPDQGTVKIVLKKPFGPFLGTLARLYVLNKKQVTANIKAGGSYGELGDYGQEWLATHDAGSGPYMVKEMRMEEALLAERFSGWWRGWTNNPDAPDFFKEINTSEPVTIKTLMSRRELEISDQWQTAEAFIELAKINGVEIGSQYTGLCAYYMMNTKKAPTDDLHFRRALAYCMDYDQVLKLQPGSKKLVGAVGSVTPGAAADLPTFSLDLEKAKAELAQSAYADQLDQYPIDILWNTDVPDQEKTALIIAQNATQIGIKVEVVKAKWIQIVDVVSKIESTPNLTFINVAPHFAEAGSMLEAKYHSRSKGTWEQAEWLEDPKMDQMIDDALATVDQAARFQKYADIQKYAVDLCPSIFLFEWADREAFQATYVDFPAVNASKKGELVNPVMGYVYFFADFKVFPDKVPAP